MAQPVHMVPRGSVLPDADGFGPPALGGRLNVKYGTVTFEDTTAKNVFSLPAGAIPVLWVVNIPEAFNSSGTNLLDIGVDGDADTFASDLDVSATGQIVIGFDPTALFVALDVDTDVIATFAQSNADADAGEATVACFYIIL